MRESNAHGYSHDHRLALSDAYVHTGR